MGSNPDLLETCASYLATETLAPRVDLNCGCPAGLVTGKGAGSSLLRDPRRVRECVAAVARGVAGTGCAVTLKLRSGFDDRGLLRENLLAAQEGGAEFITLHPRTRAQGYSGAARWEDIAFAADLLRVPVVGNGDVTTPERAFRMVRETGCAGVMIGRGAVQDPLIFHRIREAGGWFADDERAAALTTAGGRSREEEAELVRAFLRRFAEEVFAEAPRKPRRSAKRGDDLERFKLGKLKQIVKYLFASNPALEARVAEVLSADHEETSPGEMLARVDRLVAERWDTPRDVAVDGFSMRTRYERSEGGAAARGARAAT
jgi:tRNA-dihydrouridine synthase C